MGSLFSRWFGLAVLGYAAIGLAVFGPKPAAAADADSPRENIDWNVGRVLEKLDQLKIADNTIVIYFSDNGPNGSRWNGGMKGRKGSTDEGGVRVPCFVRWPGHIPAGSRVESTGGAIDLLPTLADMAGIRLRTKHPIDGISLRPLLEQTTDEWPDRMLFSHWNNRVSVRTQQYKLDHTGKLFDMVAANRSSRIFAHSASGF